MAAPGMPSWWWRKSGPREGRLAVPVEASEALSSGMRFHRRGTLSVGGPPEAPVRAVAGGADPQVQDGGGSGDPSGRLADGREPLGAGACGNDPRRSPCPRSAVVRRGQLTGVRVATADGVALRWVRLGGRWTVGDRVEVLSGLNPGDEIVR